MTGSTGAVAALEITGVTKQYTALRPLRIHELSVAHGERVAITAMDAPAAGLFVNLVTGASLPDEGEVRLFGQSTAAITNGEEWLASLDRFGIMSPKAVLLEAATVAQNLAMPFTLAIDPIAPDVRRLVDGLAEECGILREWLDQPAGETTPAVKARTHLARAIALKPALLLMEHPTAAIPEPDRPAFGADVARLCEARGQTLVALTVDAEFAAAVAHRTLVLQPATGRLAPLTRRRWFR